MTDVAHKIEDLPIYTCALEFCAAVDALLERPAMRKKRHLLNQIEEASESITANMDEGFEQPTDKAFANFLSYSKGSLAEVLGRLRAAHRKKCITKEELNSMRERGEELGKMIGGFIKYLRKSDFKNRGARHPEMDSTDEGFSD